ncbi:MAG: leucine-rich repeat domain-containing protein [Promethearchaeota archaeon]|nr:MAG: leucine-rich repeat domain-containing protein [Candidatus Lokiarchaeota archaeon]
MEITPQKICEDFRSNRLDKHSAIKQLISLIQNSDDEEIREESIYSFQKIGAINEDLSLFEILENLLISDLNEKVRIAAAKLIKNNFFYKAIKPMKWAIQHESDCECCIIIIETLVKINNVESKSILNDEIKKIKKEKYLDKSKRIDNKKFKRSIKKLLKERKYESFSHDELAQIIINYKIMSTLTKKFYSVYFELENALVVKLDLADVEYEVRGWKADFKNNITDLSEITGLKNLKNLSYIDLSNNLIRNIKELSDVENLTHLLISNNKITDIKNIDYIIQMQNLIYLDIRGNEFTAKVNNHDFENLKDKIRNFYY